MVRHAFLKDHPNDIKGRSVVGCARIRRTSSETATVLQARKTEAQNENNGSGNKEKDMNAK